MPAIEIDENHQKQIIINLIASKKTELTRLRRIISDGLKNNTIPEMEAAGPLAQIDAEKAACTQALKTIGASPIGFPSAQQLAALQKSVAAVAKITAQNATIAKVATAVSNLVTSYPP